MHTYIHTYIHTKTGNQQSHIQHAEKALRDIHKGEKEKRKWRRCLEYPCTAMAYAWPVWRLKHAHTTVGLGSGTMALLVCVCVRLFVCVRIYIYIYIYIYIWPIRQHTTSGLESGTMSFVCVCVYACICMYAYVCVCVCVCVCGLSGTLTMHTYSGLESCMRLYVHVHPRTYIWEKCTFYYSSGLPRPNCVHISVRVHIHIYLRICTWICTYLRGYVHTCTVVPHACSRVIFQTHFLNMHIWTRVMHTCHVCLAMRSMSSFNRRYTYTDINTPYTYRCSRETKDGISCHEHALN